MTRSLAYPTTTPRPYQAPPFHNPFHANMNRLWMDVQSLSANAIHNWEQGRSYDSVAAERRPGFTETWGRLQTEASRAAPPWGWSRSTTTIPTTNKDSSIVLVQYRPAWAVQLALRAAGISHQVVNATYAVSEATGPLPYLVDDMALVGNNRQILEYLLQTKQIQVLEDSTMDTVSISVELIHQLVTETLHQVVNILRYQDRQTWRTVERLRSLRAVRGNWFMGHWHVWAERHTTINSKLHGGIRTVPQAKDGARRAYAILEKVMQTQPEVFLNRQFSLVGLALFEHIMFALADAHLVTLLHHYPALCRYGQMVWEQYFARDADSHANATNSFFLLPTTWKPTTFTPRDTDESTWQARLTALARQAHLVPQTVSSPKPTPPTTAPHTESTAEAAVAAYQTADQRWMASVLLVAIVAMARTISQAQGEGE